MAKFSVTFTVPSLVGATLNENSALSFNMWLSAGSNHNPETTIWASSQALLTSLVFSWKREA